MWSSDFSPPHPPVTDRLVEEVQAALGVQLPAAYLALMREHNGGYVDEQLLRVVAAIPAELQPYIDHGYVSIGSIAGLNSDPEADGGLLQTAYLTQEWDLPAGLVLLDGDGHTWVALDYRGAAAEPPVIFLEAYSGAHVVIARDFADFLRRLVPFESVYDDDGELRDAPE